MEDNYFDRFDSHFLLTDWEGLDSYCLDVIMTWHVAAYGLVLLSGESKRRQRHRRSYEKAEKLRSQG